MMVTKSFSVFLQRLEERLTVPVCWWVYRCRISQPFPCREMHGTWLWLDSMWGHPMRCLGLGGDWLWHVRGSTGAQVPWKLRASISPHPAWHTSCDAPTIRPAEFVKCFRCFLAPSLDLYKFWEWMCILWTMYNMVPPWRCAFRCGLLTLLQATKSLWIFLT